MPPTVIDNTDVCRSCHAPILWARTGSGRSIPLDADPDPAGNIELVHGIAKSWGKAHQWPDDTVRYLSHYSTCPDADAWRKKR